VDEDVIGVSARVRHDHGETGRPAHGPESQMGIGEPQGSCHVLFGHGPAGCLQ
jgi:hypothetical protein